MPDFDLSLARTCADYCALAYTEADASDPKTDTYVIVRDAGPFIVVAWRGTTDITGWLQDARVKKIKNQYGNKCIVYGEGRVHSGFSADVESVRYQVLSLIDALPTKPIVITGHSKGAADAVLFADRYYQPILAVYTFGQPRVGDADWVANYELRLGAQTVRCVHGGDVVARIPWIGFTHTKQEAFLPEPGTNVILNPSRWTLLRDDLAGIAWELRKGSAALTADHKISTYQNRLKVATI